MLALQLGIGASKSKPKLKGATKGKKRKKGGVMEFKMPGSASRLAPAKAKKAAATKVTVSKTYDFAGESVTVEKQVDADSKEAKRFEKAKM